MTTPPVIHTKELHTLSTDTTTNVISLPLGKHGPAIPRLHLKGTSYDGAHKALKYWRGPASVNPCSNPSCTSQAAQWAFKPLTERWIQRGFQKKVGNRTTRVAWSAHISDYVPLCIPCHVALDATAEQKAHSLAA